MCTDIIGWDIGGAHLKVAHVTYDGLIKSVFQLVCPLWQGIDKLQEAIEAARQQLNVSSLNDCQHAVTMTAELVDLFEDRDQGVEVTLTQIKHSINPDQLWIFCGRDGLLTPSQVQKTHYKLLASANWLATTMLVAASLRTGLMIDIGSTTTDIVAIENHQIMSAAVTDYDRLLGGELVYTGVVRTPVMAVSRYGGFQGNRVPLMAEYFATMADVYRITNELPDHANQGETADGKPKTLQASARRLARMIGLDLQFAPMNDWVMLATSLRTDQLETIRQVVNRVLSTVSEPVSTIVGAGVGRFLAQDLAKQCGLDYRDFTDYLTCSTHAPHLTDIADHAPAVAVASLLREQMLSTR